MTRGKAETGRLGEELVARYLQERGFTILARNARVQRDEIDLVARRGSLLVFCEVRARSHSVYIDPIATIDRRKAQRARRAAAAWLRQERCSAREIRLDAAAVVLDGDEPQIRYYEGAL